MQIFAINKKIWNNEVTTKKLCTLNFKINTKMLAYENIEPKINHDTFLSIVKKRSWLQEVFLNAIYLKNSLAWIHGSYYVYFYSKKLNRCFINDLNFYGSTERLSVTNTIEQLSSKILPHILSVQKKTLHYKFDLPKFTYYYNRWYGSKEIVEQNILLKPLYDKKNNLKWFSSPDWSPWNRILDESYE